MVEGMSGLGYPTLSAPGFGRVRSGGDERRSDFFVRADGAIKERKKKKSKQTYGTSHIVGPGELEKVCKRSPATLIIAAGYGGVLRLAEEAEEYLRERGIEVELLPTPEALERYAQVEGAKAILVHVTC